MVAAALSFALLPLVLASASRLVEPANLIELTGAALVAASGALASWLAFWQSLGEAYSVLLNLISTPQAALGLVGIVAISAVGLKLFSSLLASDRSTGYA